MLKPCLATALAVLITAPTLSVAQDNPPRQRFTLPVNQIDANSFEVIEADGAGGTQFWCAASIYSRRVLGATGGDLYIETARGPSKTAPGRTGVVFTTQPVSNAFTSVSLSVREAGLTFSQGHANAVCRPFNAVRIRTGPNEILRR
ncbi:MAG: hypothetical protein AAFQ19_02265 [Pseudomonadota bacterium]